MRSRKSHRPKEVSNETELLFAFSFRFASLNPLFQKLFPGIYRSSGILVGLEEIRMHPCAELIDPGELFVSGESLVFVASVFTHGDFNPFLKSDFRLYVLYRLHVHGLLIQGRGPGGPGPAVY